MTKTGEIEYIDEFGDKYRAESFIDDFGTVTTTQTFIERAPLEVCAPDTVTDSQNDTIVEVTPDTLVDETQNTTQPSSGGVIDTIKSWFGL